MTVKDRLLLFLEHLKTGQTKFEDKVGLSRGQIAKMKSGISTESLNKISKAFPQLDTNWLQTGDGEMLKEETIDFDAGAAIREIKETTAVILAAVAEILAKETNQSSTVVRDQLQGLVNKRLGKPEPSQ